MPLLPENWIIKNSFFHMNTFKRRRLIKAKFCHAWATPGCVSLRAVCECSWAQSCSDQGEFSGLCTEKSQCGGTIPPSKQ